MSLAYECPFRDVREKCSRIIKNLEANGVIVPKRCHIGPSKFVSLRDCVPTSIEDNEIHKLFVEAFCMNGRTSHINQLQAYHVKYLTCFLQFENHLMRLNSPLSIQWRYYIGIMGASRHHCSMLIEKCEHMFLMHGGDPQWLEGVEHTPKKLRKLNNINKILAHKPWLLMFSPSHIKELLFCEDASESWTIPELIQAIVILVHFQTLSGFVYGCGISPEIDMRKGHTTRRCSTSIGEYSGSEPVTPTKLKANSFDSKIEESITTAELFKKIQKVQSEEADTSQEEEDKLRQFKEVETKELEDIEDHTNGIDTLSGKYIDDVSFRYEDFAKIKEKKDFDVFRAQDYNWQEHGYSFINRLYPEIGTLLDDKFNCTYNLTYYTMGDNFTNVDTSKFRLATWNYIHVLYGIFHDDYIYDEVNKLLEKSYKSYIKKVACFPDRITFTDYWDFYTDMLPSEKVHINLLVLESRLQAALLYASRALMKHIN